MVFRLKFSVENAYTVSIFMSVSRHQSRTSSRVSRPKRWPVSGASPRVVANRRLPSIMIAMCLGTGFFLMSWSSLMSLKWFIFFEMYRYMSDLYMVVSIFFPEDDFSAYFSSWSSFLLASVRSDGFFGAITCFPPVCFLLIDGLLVYNFYCAVVSERSYKVYIIPGCFACSH